MRCAHRSYLPGLLVLLLLLGFVAPQAAAQDIPPEQSCPEGLVYYEPGDICLLPEDIPSDQEEGDQPVDDAQQSTEDQQVPEEDQSIVGEQVDDTTDDEQPPAEDGEQGQAEAGSAAQIRNLTLLTFSCPINWDPATRDIEASREMCTEPIVPAMNYTILFKGQEMVTTALGTDVDLAKDLGLNGVPLPTGMWTIRENLQEGLDDPFAFCAIYAADGSTRLTVAETVPGGSLDILLAADEEVNCEWYSVATVPEVTGDPNALPIGGLKLDGFSCPYGTDDFSTREYLVATCIEKGVAGVEYVASLNGAAVSTQAGATDTPGVDFQKGLDTRLLSGTWTLSANLPPEYEESFMFCSITSEAGTATELEPETFFGSIELDLQPGDTGFCQWFHVESEPRSGPSLGISLLLHTCPEGFDPDNGDYQTCTLPLQEPIAFDFIRAGKVVETGTASPPDTELAATTNDGHPEAGEWTIRPNLPDNRIEPGWACWGVDNTDMKVLGIDYFAPTDGGTGISAKFGPNLMLQCDVWIYAGDLSKAVQVVAHTCAEGFDAANPAGDRAAACSKTRGIEFTYTVDDAPAGGGTSGRNGLAFTPAQPGQWRITAVPEEGAGVTFVTCDHTQVALNVVQTIEPTINSDQRSITLDLDEGDALRCDFFIGPAAASTGTDTSALEPAADDTAEEEPATDAASEPAETDSTGDENAGVDPDPDTGDTGEGTDPADTTPGGDTFGGGSGATESGTGETGVEPADDTAVPEITSGGTTDESAAGGTSELSIQHYACNSPVADATVDDLVENCTASVEPSAWQLNGEPLDLGDGYAVWDGLEPGTMSVSNTAAAGKDDAASVVYCSIAPSDGVPLVGVEVPVKDGAIGLVIDQPAVIYCAWFVAP